MSAGLSSTLPRDVDDFIAHWRAIAKEGLLPGLQAFLAARPFRLQSEIAIADVVGPTDMRFRLFGTGLVAIAGRDLTGSDALAFFRPEIRAEAARIIWSAMSQPCGYILRRDMHLGQITTTALGIGLPLRNEKNGRTDLVSFTSMTDRVRDVTTDVPSQFAVGVKLLQWIDIGAGVPVEVKPA